MPFRARARTSRKPRRSPAPLRRPAARQLRFGSPRSLRCRPPLRGLITPLAWGVLALCACLLAAPSGWAQSDLPPELSYSYGETETPRATAVSGALRATGSSTSSLFTNPANMAIAQLYHAGAFAQIDPEAGRQTYGAAVVDSLVSSTGLAGGLSGSWNLQDPSGVDREWYDARFGLAVPVADLFYFGASARYLVLKQEGAGPLGASRVSGGVPDGPILETVTFDLGATLRPVPEFMIAITGHNLTAPDHGFLPLMGGAALGFANDEFAIGADAILEGTTFDETMVRAQGGAEVLIAERLFVRAGYRFDQGQTTHSVSGGLGYADRRFSADLGLRRTVAGPELTTVTFGFTLHVEALGLGSPP